MKKYILTICCVLCSIIISISCVNSVKVNAESSGFSVDAKACYLMDFNSETVLYENNADEKMPVASIVKLMTALITMEEIDNGTLKLEDTLTTSEQASSMGGSQVFIDPYVEYTVADMLKSVIVASANDASVALAEKIAGSEEAFVQRMNKRAKELGLNGTSYVNASGLPEPGQYSTARDVAKLTKQVLKHKRYFEFSTIWMDELTHPSGRKTELVNTNKLIRYFKGCDAGKTGSTDEAGYCLAASAERGNMRLIGVILGAMTSTQRFNETSKLLNYGFTNFEEQQIVDFSNSIAKIDIVKGKTKEAEVFAKENYYVISKKGQTSDYETVLELPENIKAPINKGEVIGKLKILKQGAVIKEIDIVILQEVEALGFKDGLKEIISRW